MSWKPLPDYRSPEVDISESLDLVMRRLGGVGVRTQQAVLDCWGEAVGQDISRHASAVSLSDGVLSVEVDDPRWLTQLKWMGGRIADRLNQATGTEAVERLSIRLRAANNGPRTTANRP